MMKRVGKLIGWASLFVLAIILHFVFYDFTSQHSATIYFMVTLVLFASLGGKIDQLNLRMAALEQQNRRLANKLKIFREEEWNFRIQVSDAIWPARESQSFDDVMAKQLERELEEELKRHE